MCLGQEVEVSIQFGVQMGELAFQFWGTAGARYGLDLLLIRARGHLGIEN